MASVVTTKQLNGKQINSELGVASSRCIGEPLSTSNKTLVVDDVTQPTLDAYIATYTYDASFGVSGTTAAIEAAIAQAQDVYASLDTYSASEIQINIAGIILYLADKEGFDIT